MCRSSWAAGAWGRRLAEDPVLVVRCSAVPIRCRISLPSHRATAFGLLAGMLADSILGDPARWHPVAGFGQGAGWIERRLWRDSRVAGAVFLAAAAIPATGASVLLVWRSSGLRRVAAVAVATWACVGARSLHGCAERVRVELAAGRLDGARDLLPALCGRDPAGLDEPAIARAVVESVAENTADAVVAPLLWGAVFGVPGLVGYRAVNTLDAMVGYRSPRYRSFGTASARCDDVATFVPARVTGLLTVALAAGVGGSSRSAWAVFRRDRRSHPSPNAGQCEAAFAGALGVRLGGVNRYGDQVEARPELGDGGPSGPGTIADAVRLSRAVGWAAAGLASVIALGAGRR